MINLIYGAKGSGKTKRSIDAANSCAAKAKGDVVYITDNDRSVEISNKIRFINIKDYNVCYECCFVAFIKGMVAANTDTEHIYIDGILRMLEFQPDKTEEIQEYILTELDSISTLMKVDFTLTISADVLPKFMKKYV